MKEDYDIFLNKVKKAEPVAIFGAGKFAKTLCYLCDRKEIRVDVFVVTEIEKNQQILLHRPVISLEEFQKQGKYTLVVGREQRKDAKADMGVLLDRHVKKIVMVPDTIINDIYCNFIMDGSSLEVLCRGLREERKIIAVANDAEGMAVIQYLRIKDIKIDAIWTEHTDILMEETVPVLQYSQAVKEDADKECAIILTSGSTDHQRRYVNALRSNGFERIILISDEVLRFIRTDYRRCIWESSDAHFSICDTQNVEKGHYIIDKKDKSDWIRWRTPIWDRRPYSEETIRYIQDGEICRDFEKQFPGCTFLPYQDTNLCGVYRPDIELEVYMAKSHKDKFIEQTVLPDWVIPIQVGKELTDVRIARITDNTGKNISDKNADYSEGTALYWMWKNTRAQDYIGLFHYRRQMAMGEDTLKDLLQYDVLLTVPTYISVGIKDFFCEHYILEQDWTRMMKYMKEYDRAYYDTALAYEKMHFYFPCNIFIMRRRCFDTMCSFIFGVLEKVDEYYRSMNMIREDRYLGFLVENLLSIYIMHHVKELKVSYTDMKYYYPLNEGYTDGRKD